MINVTQLDLTKSDKAVRKSYEVTCEKMTRAFKVETPKGVVVGSEGDYLVEYEDGTRDALSPEAFEAVFEIKQSKRKSTKQKELDLGDSNE